VHDEIIVHRAMAETAVGTHRRLGFLEVQHVATLREETAKGVKDRVNHVVG